MVSGNEIDACPLLQCRKTSTNCNKVILNVGSAQPTVYHLFIPIFTAHNYKTLMQYFQICRQENSSQDGWLAQGEEAEGSTTCFVLGLISLRNSDVI